MSYGGAMASRAKTRDGSESSTSRFFPSEAPKYPFSGRWHVDRRHRVYTGRTDPATIAGLPLDRTGGVCYARQHDVRLSKIKKDVVGTN